MKSMDAPKTGGTGTGPKTAPPALSDKKSSSFESSDDDEKEISADADDDEFDAYGDNQQMAVRKVKTDPTSDVSTSKAADTGDEPNAKGKMRRLSTLDMTEYQNEHAFLTNNRRASPTHEAI